MIINWSFQCKENFIFLIFQNIGAMVRFIV